MGLSHRGCVEIVVFTLENAVWLPYKVIVSPFSGGFQGVMGAAAATDDPVAGTLLAPVGLAVGLTIGLFNGLSSSPM